MPNPRRDDIIEWSIGVLLGLGIIAPNEATRLRSEIYNSNIARGTNTEQVQENVMRYALQVTDEIDPIADEAVRQVEQIMSFPSQGATRDAAAVGLPEAVRRYGQEGGSANAAIATLRNLGITETQAEQLRGWAASSDGTDKAVYELALGAGFLSPRDLDANQKIIGYSREDLDPSSPGVAAALGIGGGVDIPFGKVADFAKVAYTPLWVHAVRLAWDHSSSSTDERQTESLLEMRDKIDELADSGALTEEKAKELKTKLQGPPGAIVGDTNYVAAVELELIELGVLNKKETQEVSRIAAKSVDPDAPVTLEEIELSEQLDRRRRAAGGVTEAARSDGVGGIPGAPVEEEEILADFRTWIGNPPPGFKPGWGVFDTRDTHTDPQTGEEVPNVDPATGRVTHPTGSRSELSQRQTVLTSIYGAFPALRTTAVHAATGASAAMLREQAAEYREDDPRMTRLRYYDGDQLSLRYWSATSVRSLQSRLADAGMLVNGKYSPGMADVITVDAFSDLLSMSNGSGQRWDRELTYRVDNIDPSVLEDYQNQFTPKPAKDPIRLIDPFIAPTFLKPDYASLTQGVKQSLRDQLRREPTDSEMRQLTSFLDAEYRSQYDAEVRGLRGEYDARVSAFQSDAYEAGEATYGSGGEVRDVDPTARYAEEFERKFSGELDLIKRNESTLDAQVRTGAAIGKLTAMVSRGR